MARQEARFKERQIKKTQNRLSHTNRECKKKSCLNDPDDPQVSERWAISRALPLGIGFHEISRKWRINTTLRKVCDTNQLL